jgi:hypothetical protein
MKRLALAIFLALTSLAMAQDSASISQWVTDILAHRATTSWSPALFADPETAAMLGTINGLPVTADPAIGVHGFVIRNVDAFVIRPGQSNEVDIPAGQDMASMSW